MLNKFQLKLRHSTRPFQSNREKKIGYCFMYGATGIIILNYRHLYNLSPIRVHMECDKNVWKTKKKNPKSVLHLPSSPFYTRDAMCFLLLRSFIIILWCSSSCESMWVFNSYTVFAFRDSCHFTWTVTNSLLGQWNCLEMFGSDDDDQRLTELFTAPWMEVNFREYKSI